MSFNPKNSRDFLSKMRSSLILLIFSLVGSFITVPIGYLLAEPDLSQITEPEYFSQIPTRLSPKPPQTPIPTEPLEPILETPSTPSLPPIDLDTPDQIRVGRFEFEGNTAFSNEELEQVVALYIGREITFTELLEAETAITNLYVNAGYLNSGAVIKAGQTLSTDNAVITVTIVEGSIEDIQVSGTRRLNPDYIRSRLAIATSTPLNQNRLLEALQLLQLNPLIKNISAELAAGVRSDQSLLLIKVTEADSFSVDLFADNGRNPSVGDFQRGIRIEEGNLFGLGDSIAIRYRNTDGSNAVDASYTIPINPYNGTIELATGYSSNEVIEQLFDELDITGSYLYYELRYRQPVIQTPNEEFALGLTLSRQESKNLLQGEGFPLSPGSNDKGDINISAIRFFQDWLIRGSQEVFAVRSQFSFGINAFDATINEDGLPDSTFFTWRTQGQYVRLLAPDTLLVVRSDLQLSTDPLLALEQFSLGGLGTVRGYRQDFLLTDNAFFASAEVRLPIFRAPNIDGVLQIIPFVDFGVGWNVDVGEFSTALDPNTLASVGLGLQWQMGDQLRFRFDWGIPLVPTDIERKTLNEKGLYFSFDFNF